MATDNYTIEFNGISLEIPAWATEKTLDVVAHNLKESNLLTEIIAKSINEKNIDTQKIAESIKGHADAKLKEHKKQEKRRTSQLNNQIRKGAEATRNTIDKFSNTDAPLSTMVEVAGTVGSALLGVANTAITGAAGLLGMGAGASALSGVFGTMGHVGLAWAGFQAGQLEQFASAQQTLINSGAIFIDGASPFETLKNNVISSGISYTQFTKVVGENGIAMQGLGGGVSKGSQVFANMFKQVNIAGDKVGDYGLRSAEMSEILANYINVQRMSTAQDMKLRSTQDKVQLGFHDLMIETTALANLTGQNRSEMLQDRLAALSKPQVAAALQTMEEAGGGHAEVARDFISQFAILSKTMGPIGQQISDKFNDYIFRIADDPASFDMTVALGPQLATALNEANNGILTRIEDVFRSGDTEGAKRLLIKEFAKLKDANVGSSNIVVGSIQDFVQQLKAGGVNTTRKLNELANMTDQEYKQQLEETKVKLEESGKMTEVMNDLSRTFLEIQHSLVWNVDEAAEFAENLADKLVDGVYEVRGFIDSVKTHAATIVAQYNNGTLSEYAMDVLKKNVLDPVIDAVTPDVNRNDGSSAAARFRVEKKYATDIGAGNLSRAEVAHMAKIEQINDPKSQYAGLADKARAELLKKEQDLLAGATARRKKLQAAKAQSANVEQRQIGGPVEQNTAYIVGEKGPELFVPSVSGQIVDSDKTQSMMNNSTMSTDNTVMKELNDIIVMKQNTVQLMTQLSDAMKSIKRSKDYQRAVDGSA